MIVANSFGKKIREMRLRANLSLRDLAERSGVSYSFIGSLEQGRFNPSRETVIRLARALHADPSELLILAGFFPEGTELNNVETPVKTTKSTENGAMIDEEWVELIEKVKERGAELEAGALLRSVADGRMTKQKLRDILRAFDIIERDEG